MEMVTASSQSAVFVGEYLDLKKAMALGGGRSRVSKKKPQRTQRQI